MNPAVGSLSTTGSNAVYTIPSTLSNPQSIEISAVSMANPTVIAKSFISLVPLVSISVIPSVATLYPGRSQQFNVAVQGQANTAVRWTITPPIGTITSSGLYTAPALLANSQQVTVTATSLVESTKQSSSRIRLRPAPTALLYCTFETSGSPCNGPNQQVIRVLTDTQGRFGNGLRLCKGTTNCNSSSGIRFNGETISMRRGTIAFWFKQNSNVATSGPTELFDTFPSSPNIKASFKASVAHSVSDIQAGRSTTLSVPGHGLVTGDSIRLQGGTNDWASSNQEWPVRVLDLNTIQIQYDSMAKSASSMQRLSLLTAGTVNITYSADNRGDAYKYLTLTTRPMFLAAGEWVHIAWAWSGSQHRIYQNGNLGGTFEALSPFPYTAVQPALRIGISNGGTQDVSIDDLASYDFAFSDQEALAASRTSAPGPQDVLSPHGLTLSAQWGPGEKKVHVTVDAGNDYSTIASSIVVDVSRDGTIQSSMTFDRLRDGFAEGVIDISQFTSGSYIVSARAMQEQVVIATSQTAPYVFTKPSWLGNTYGIDNVVATQYWNPVTLSGFAGNTVNVVHRSYMMESGYGLPTQMSSLGRNILAAPIALEIEQSGSVLPINNRDITFSPITPHTATWQGRANAAGQLHITIDGQVEYDGMMLLSITLNPTSSPVALDAVRLRTRLNRDFAKYVFAIKDQPFWWYTWSVAVPQAIGEFNNNLTQTPRGQRTDNIFSTVFSDDDRGLQIFHNNMAGWKLNETKPWQRFIREADGTVSYVSDLANSAFTLSEPMTVVIGYMATPVKRLPSSWRLAAGGAYGGTRAPQSDLEYYFDFTLGHGWSTFGLSSTSPAEYKSRRVDPIRAHNQTHGKKVLPFVNAHVLVPTAPATWDELNVIKQETLNDEWNSSPSRGAGDYWAWSMNRLLNDSSSSDIVDGYYIDESYGYLANSSLLSGAGYIKPDGTHGIGLNLLGARDKFKRLAKLLIASNRSPNLWFHTTGKMYPHMWSHGMMTFDGELPMIDNKFYVDADSDQTPDHFDIWNDGDSLLDLTKKGRGSWLRGIGRSGKFGFIPVMWRGIECCNKPYEEKKQRQAQCLYQMHDMLQQDQTLLWWQPKYNLGIYEPGVTFQGYWSNTLIVSTDPQIKVSYYQGPKGVLAYVANFGSGDWTGPLSLGGINGLTVTDAENSNPVIKGPGGAINLTVKRHDCRVIAVQ